jgi:hypothetical protein
MPVTAPIDALTLRPPGPELVPRPSRIAVLCPPAGSKGGARMRLRMRAAHTCDLHPWARLNDSLGVRDWRGALANDVTWAVPTPAPVAPTVPALQPTIAAEVTPDLQSLDVHSCGLRDSGAPMGDLHLVVAAYPGEQHLMSWKREPWPVLGWPDAGSAPPLPTTQLRLERDGVAIDAAAWQAGFQALDEQLVRRPRSAGQRLGAHQWRDAGRVSRPSRGCCAAIGDHLGLGRATARAAGGALPAHCWRDGPDCLPVEPAVQRCAVAGWVAEPARPALRRGRTGTDRVGAAPDDADQLAALASAKAGFRQPFVLVVESAALDELAMLNAASLVTGALVGSCGLRLRPEGSGCNGSRR